MKNQTVIFTGAPPRLIPTLLKGFNTIANNAYLLLFPVFIDLLLWLGPKLRLKTLMMPFINEFSADMLKISPPELLDTVKTSQTLWEQLLNQFNLATALRTFPVGIPSIIARQSPAGSPLGQYWVYEIPSVQWAFAILGAVLLIGFLLGSLYFYFIARVTATDVEKLSGKQILTAYAQSLIMFCLFLGVAILIMIPLFLILSILSLANAGIGQFFLLVAALVLLWLVMPLVFSPHGVFVLKQKALPSMMISIRLVRLFLPGTGLFVMTSVLISEGLNNLWTIPEANSWLTLFGIGGHSFIITSLLAASFIYYREGLRWMQENLQRLAEAAQQKHENGGTTLEQQ
ncbi:MAG: hypothetical protein C0410_01810 [Anaerolinea sp.]|nr:hypothetical protein [Anaerolinea sp.]